MSERTYYLEHYESCDFNVTWIVNSLESSLLHLTPPPLAVVTSFHPLELVLLFPFLPLPAHQPHPQVQHHKVNTTTIRQQLWKHSTHRNGNGSNSSRQRLVSFFLVFFIIFFHYTDIYCRLIYNPTNGDKRGLRRNASRAFWVRFFLIIFFWLYLYLFTNK